MARVLRTSPASGVRSDVRDRGPTPILESDRMNATAAAPVPNEKKKAPWEGLEITWWTVRDSNPGPWD